MDSDKLPDEVQKGYKPFITPADKDRLLSITDVELVFGMLAEPLHEELFRQQNFEFLDFLNNGQRAVLLLDYVRAQVLQGGFIQLIQNGYVDLLLPLIETLKSIESSEDFIKTLDDSLKVYVLNRELLDKETTVTEFGKLYEEFKEFELLDAAFAAQLKGVIETLVEQAKGFLEAFFAE